MADLYVDETWVSNDWETAASDVEEGELVTRDSGGGVAPTDPSSDSRVDGIVPHLRRGDHIAEHDEDFSSDVYTYVASDDDSVPIVPIVEGLVPHPKTVKEANSTDGAPDIERNDLVVVVDLGNGPVAVEDGYTDNAGTIYGPSGGSGDYISLGYADHGPVDTKGERVPVRIAHDV